jgi:hypothetical protein
MSNRLQIPRATGGYGSVTLLPGEVLVDTAAKRLVIGDGAASGGIPLAQKAEVDAKQDTTQVTAAVGATLSAEGVADPDLTIASGYTQLYTDLINRWWDPTNNRIWGMTGGYARDNTRPWEWTMSIFHMNIYWKAKQGDADAQTKVGQNFIELLGRRGQSFLSTVSTTDHTSYIGGSDDLSWCLMYYTQVHDITANATALQIASDLFASGLTVFADPAAKGAGLLYVTDDYAATFGHYRVCATNDIFTALAGLYIDEKKGTTTRRSFATNTYAWVKQYAFHPKGVLYCEVNLDPAVSGTPKSFETTPLTPIAPHYALTTIAFSFAFMTLCKRLNDVAPNAQYITDINNMMAAILRSDTYLRPGNILLPDRDGWGNGLGFPNFVAEVLPLAGLNATLVAKMKRAILSTALSVCRQRTDNYYFNANTTFGAGFYGADWTGPELGTNGMMTWFQTGNSEGIAVPEQIMTTGNNALVVTAAAMISGVAGSTQLVSWNALTHRLQQLAQGYVPLLGATTLRDWLGASVFYPANGKPGSGFFLGNNSTGNPTFGFDAQDFFTYDKAANQGSWCVGGAVKFYFSSAGAAAIGGFSATGDILAGTGTDLNFGLTSNGSNRAIAFDTGGDYLNYLRSSNQYDFVIANTSRFVVNVNGAAAIGGFSATGDILAGASADLNFGLTSSGSNRAVSFDTGGDYLNYLRSSNQYDFVIGNTSKFAINGSGASTSGSFSCGGNLTVGGSVSASGGFTFNAASAVYGTFNSGTMGPITDGGSTLGNGSFRMGQIYSTSSTISTSDAREKTWRGPLSATELAAAKDIMDATGIYQWNNSIDEKGEAAARLHCGVEAQTVIAIMISHGLDPMRYGFICYDEWPEHVAFDGGPTVPAGDRYGVRYNELDRFTAAGLHQRLLALEAA